MALPIAQLGYMPNINAPSHVPSVPYEDPWAKLAQMVLMNVAQGAVANGMSRDYASQATAESPEKVTAGPFISPETGQSSGGPSTVLGPQDAPWYSKILQGPAMDAKQYAGIRGEREGERTQKASQAFQSGEKAKDRTADMTMAGQRIAQGDRQIATEYDKMSQEAALHRQGLLQQGQYQTGQLAIDQQNANTRANPPLDQDALQRVVGSMATDIYKARLEQWQRAALLAQQTNGAVPPQPTFDGAVSEAASAAQRFMGVRPIQAPLAPPTPLR